MNDKNYVLTGYAAAKLRAINDIGLVRPGGKAIPPLSYINWEDASEEIKNDVNISWWNGRAIRPHTQEEKEEIKLNEQWRIVQIYNFLLQTYGWEYAELYKKENKKIIVLYDIKLEEAIPHCKYVEDGQCDLFCCFFNGGCNYENNL